MKIVIIILILLFFQYIVFGFNPIYVRELNIFKTNIKVGTVLKGKTRKTSGITLTISNISYNTITCTRTHMVDCEIVQDTIHIKDIDLYKNYVIVRY